MKYSRLFFIPLIATCSLLTISCKDTSKSHDLSPASENIKIEITEEDKKEIIAFAEELTKTVNEGDSSFLEGRFNILRLGELALTGLNLSDKEKRDFEAYTQKGLPNEKKQLMKTLGSSQVKFIKLVHETRPALLFRLITEDGGFTYGEFILEKRASDQEWEIVDLFMYSIGKRTSEVMRDIFAQMLPVSGKKDPVMMKAVEKLQTVIKLNQTGDYQQAWSEWKKINSKAHKNRAILMQGYMAAFQIYYSNTDETEPLLKVISIIEKEFPSDAGLAILQLSVHEINKDSKRYRETVQKIRDKVGNDPFLDLIESTADVIDGNYGAILKKATEFKNIEPDVMMVYPLIWGAYLGQGDYKRLGTSLDDFNEQYGIDVSLFIEDPDFKPFFDSLEGKAWLEKHKE